MAEKPKFSLDRFKSGKEAKEYTYTFTLQGLISIGGGALLALTLFFILGILIGRGYRPEQDVPKLADIMPTKQHGNATVTKPKVLKATDLDYPETLKKKPGTVATAMVKKPEPVTPAPKKPEAKKPVPVKVEPKAEPKKAEPVAKPGEPVYDYKYQAAAFRKMEMAKVLEDKINKQGLKTHIEEAKTSSGKWYRIMVLHRGTSDSAGTVLAKLKKAGIVKPFRKAKTLVK